MRKKLAIISSHPIQYNAPLFALLANEKEIDLMVFYTWGDSSMDAKYDPDFGQIIKWDIPLLNGYKFKFLENISTDPGSHHFNGIVNPSLTKDIEKWGAEILWVWGWAFDSHLKVMRHFHGKIPVWFRGDSTLLDEPYSSPIKNIFRRLFLIWVYRHVDIAFYVGINNREYFKKHKLKERQLIYAPHAIDNNRFLDVHENFAKSAQIWKEKMGIKKVNRVLLFVGKFEKKKNPFFFKKIVSDLESEGFIGIMIGNGKLEGELKNNAPKNLIFLPFQNQSEMPIVYRLGDVLMLPSIGPGETWGLVINEALASGTKVIASDKCGGAIDLINSSNGIIYNSKDISKVLYFLRNFKKIDSKSNLLQGHTYLDLVKSVHSQIHI